MTIIGVDCGSTYTKAVAYCPSRERRVGVSRPSPWAFDGPLGKRVLRPDDWWSVVAVVLRETARELGSSRLPETVCVSCISPVLVLFDAHEPSLAIGLPYWHVPDIDGGLQGDERLVVRLDAISRKGAALQFKRPMVCDLLGYIGFRLTETLGLSHSISSEFGNRTAQILTSYQDVDGPSVIGEPESTLGAVTQAASIDCGLSRGARVLFGSSDSYAFAVALGVSPTAKHALYLGTFGGLMEYTADSKGSSTQYCWRISVPELGPIVELQAAKVFPGVPGVKRLPRLDDLAASAPTGADGVLCLLPVLDSVGDTYGKYMLSRSGTELLGDQPPHLAAGALFEAMGYLVRHVLPGAQDIDFLSVGGGGAKSQVWAQAIANSSRITVCTSALQQEVNGAIMIAGFQLPEPQTISMFLPTEIPDEVERILHAQHWADAWYGNFAADRTLHVTVE
jgi:sugar (pentulose or hexulose) kinase